MRGGLVFETSPAQFGAALDTDGTAKSVYGFARTHHISIPAPLNSGNSHRRASPSPPVRMDDSGKSKKRRIAAPPSLLPSASSLPAFHEKQGLFYSDCCAPVVAAANTGEIDLSAWGRYGYPGERLPDDSLAGLSSVGSWNASSPQSWGLCEHRNEGIEFTFLFTGKIGVAVDGKPRPMGFDQMLVTRPWQPHQLGSPNLPAHHLAWLILDVGVRRPHQPWKWPAWIILEPSDLSELTDFLRQNEQPLWSASPEIRRSFEAITQVLRIHPLQRGLSAMRVEVNALLLRVLEFFRKKDISLTESLTGAERSVEQFLAELIGTLDRSWTVDQMAESCGLGVTRFVHYVRQLTNLSPAEFLLQHRLESACLLLRQAHGETSGAIARRCGFASSQHFTRVFHRRFGCTPGEYRRREEAPSRNAH